MRTKRGEIPRRPDPALLLFNIVAGSNSPPDLYVRSYDLYVIVHVNWVIGSLTQDPGQDSVPDSVRVF